MFNVSIPEISDEELKKRYEQIKPVITVNGKLYYLRKFSFDELRSLNYIWNLDGDVRKKVGENRLKVLEDRDFICLHGYVYPGFFIPTIAEVLSQIKENDIPFVKAFEIIEKPQTSSDFYKNSFTAIAFDNGYHVSTVRLYGEKI